MKILDSIKRSWKNEGFVRIRKYIQKPAFIAFVIADIVVFLLILVLLIIGKLEDLIVSMNIRYNSPAFVALAIAFFIVQIGAIGYGVVLSLRKYRRPSGRGIFRPLYENGSSYKALHEYLDYCANLTK